MSWIKALEAANSPLAQPRSDRRIERYVTTAHLMSQRTQQTRQRAHARTRYRDDVNAHAAAFTRFASSGPSTTQSREPRSALRENPLSMGADGANQSYPGRRADGCSK